MFVIGTNNGFSSFLRCFFFARNALKVFVRLCAAIILILFLVCCMRLHYTHSHFSSFSPGDEYTHTQKNGFLRSAGIFHCFMAFPQLIKHHSPSWLEFNTEWRCLQKTKNKNPTQIDINDCSSSMRIEILCKYCTAKLYGFELKALYLEQLDGAKRELSFISLFLVDINRS